jgi:hypothetical protein
MFKPVPQGSSETIYGYKCQIPPLGYGVSSVDGLLAYVGILKISDKKSEQKWKRTELPKDWAKKRKAELLKQQADAEYCDPELESFRQQEWLRRIHGFWVQINGTPYYLTGLYYFYLCYWKMDSGFPDYRDTDRKFFYVLDYCIGDPRCAGLIYCSNRRAGKTYKGTVFEYEYVSRSSNKYAGIQSKTAPDAKGIFQNKLINAFYNLPDFFIPVFDTGKGARPTSELRFQRRTATGKRAMEDFGKPELNSWIDWKSSERFAYDGTKLHRYLGDEVGKTADVDVYDRHQVVKYCLTQGGKWIGKALYTTTVEEMESGGEKFKLLWEDSDGVSELHVDGKPNRNANGQTRTGLYRYFVPAFEATSFDDYGMPNVEDDRQMFLNTRAALQNNKKALYGEIRKNAFDEDEMFMIDGSVCMYNSGNINEQLSHLSWNKDLYERGNFEWEGGIRDTKVVWVKSDNGRWLIARGFQPTPEEVNLTQKVGSSFRPTNNFRFGTGCDPYDHDSTEDGRNSNGTSVVKMKCNFHNMEDLLINGYVCRYKARPLTADLFYEDMIKQCFYFGCEILAENNKQGILKYFRQRGYGAFLMHLHGYKEPGIPSTPENKQTASELLEYLIENHCHRIVFPDVLKDWLGFDIKKTQKWDLAMATLWTEIACAKPVKRRDNEKTKEVTKYFRNTPVPR